ncbi:hypothetical protein VBD025_08575 [Virgibacillus flavescens]|uniref:hypothetical protein n=1 Tax=Virgibacillus flavescens TaxID=1611422 RepID=UPI003D34C08E
MTFQPVMVPVVYAVESWSGNSWEGTPWEGKPWDGSDLQWEGKSWEGNEWTGKSTDGESWNGKGTEGNGTNGQGTTGYDWQTLPWYMKGWNQPGFGGNQGNSVGNGSIGNPWLYPGWNGSETNGSPWANSEFAGEGTTGTPWANSGWNGQYGLGSPWTSYGPNGYGIMANPGDTSVRYRSNIDDGESIQEQPFYETDGFKISKYIIGDVIGGQATMISGAMKYERFSEVGKKGSGFDFGAKTYGNLLVNGFKLGGIDNGAIDAYDTASKIDEGIQGLNKFRQARNVGETSESAIDTSKSKALRNTKFLSKANKAVSLVDKIPKPPAVLEKALSKFNVPAAALGTIASTAKTVDSWDNASRVLDSNASGTDKTVAVADVTENIGDTAMNLGVVTSAIPLPGARVLGGAMVVGGAVLWGVSKAAKLIAGNWNTIKNSPKKAWEGTKNIAKKGWNALTGIFG